MWKRLEYFGYENIRPNQEQVVRNQLEGNEVLLCSPTGSGKTLTFELASFVFKCLSTDQSAPATVSCFDVISSGDFQNE